MGLPRGEISRRLKAARALRGVDVKTLARHPVMRANLITANLIGETERQDRDARPMELRAVAEALDLPYEWFTAEDPFDAIRSTNRDQLQEIRDLLDEIITVRGRELVDEVLEAVHGGEKRVMRLLRKTGAPPIPRPEEGTDALESWLVEAVRGWADQDERASSRLREVPPDEQRSAG